VKKIIMLLMCCMSALQANPQTPNSFPSVLTTLEHRVSMPVHDAQQNHVALVEGLWILAAFLGSAFVSIVFTYGSTSGTCK
jgi:hypothetical protein